jgi:hypothetical protein
MLHLFGEPVNLPTALLKLLRLQNQWLMTANCIFESVSAKSFLIYDLS